MRPQERRAFDSQVFLTKIGEGKTITEYPKNQTIFAQGSPADAIFYIQKGSVKLTVVSAIGKQAIVATLGRGSFFGEGCLAGQPWRTATAKTLTASSILRLEKSVMTDMLHREASVAKLFITHLLSRNIRIEEDLVDQLFNSSEKRLARMLLLFANLDKAGKSDVVIPKISQETLAEIVGTTRSRISFFMNRFRKLGYIEYKGE